MGEVRFMISEAAKQVKVESHVLRYWEEELNLDIGRTEMGHRYYTKDDIQLFRCIKKLKDEGMLLKDLKPLIPELKETRLRLQNPEEPKTQNMKKSAEPVDMQSQKKSTENAGTKTADNLSIEKDKPAQAAPVKPDTPASTQNADVKIKPAAADTPSPEKAVPAEVKTAEVSVGQADIIPITQLEQVRTLIGDVLTEVVTTNNENLKKDISRTVTKDVMREMDLLFQAKERQEEEHFRKLDCLIRQQQANRREAARENPIGKLKKLLT
jgi:DNA-binding transcriptional MerR regulator